MKLFMNRAGKFGLFGFISNATVQNFSIEGALSVTGATGTGAIGWSSSSRISNVHSSLNITINETNVHHVGGVVGSAQYKNRITGCSFSGTLTEAAGNNDCFGGVIGYMAEDTVLFCANYGTVTYVVANGSVGLSIFSKHLLYSLSKLGVSIPCPIAS